jgi:hypothetical protein
MILIILLIYYLGGQIEKNEMGGACSTYGEIRGVHRALVGKPEGKKPLGRPRHRWEDNIKMDLREWDGEWTGLILLRLETSGWRL